MERRKGIGERDMYNVLPVGLNITLDLPHNVTMTSYGQEAELI